jgi:hypothetical protein
MFGFDFKRIIRILLKKLILAFDFDTSILNLQI